MYPLIYVLTEPSNAIKVLDAASFENIVNMKVLPCVHVLCNITFEGNVDIHKYSVQNTYSK